MAPRSNVAPAPQPISEFPSTLGLLLRGLSRRCAWCGDRKAYFVGWYKRQHACRKCGHGYRRGDVGFEWGAVTINVILTFLVILVSIGVVIVLTVPDIPVLPLTLAAAVFGLFGPILLWPVSFTTWQAIDLIARPPTPGELAGEGDAHL